MEIFRNLASCKINSEYAHSVTPLFLYKTKNLTNMSLKNSTIFKAPNSNQVKEILGCKNSVIYKTNYKLNIIIYIKSYI